MTHPIVELQASLVAALLADGQLTAALGGDAVYDTPPKNAQAPYVAIVRHDVLPRDGDDTPGNDHRLLLQCWHSQASRKAVLGIADRVIAVALTADISSAGLLVTHVQHDRTDTAIDVQTGWARAAVTLRFLSEGGS